MRTDIRIEEKAIKHTFSRTNQKQNQLTYISQLIQSIKMVFILDLGQIDMQLRAIDDDKMSTISVG